MATHNERVALQLETDRVALILQGLLRACTEEWGIREGEAELMAALDRYVEDYVLPSEE